MTATEVTGQGPALPGRLARSLRGAALAGASVAGVSAAGALVSVRAAYPRPPRAAPAEGWPSPRPVPQGRLAVAVALGASGSVITDALGPYEVFARSAEFFVYTVSARPTATLSGALAVVPDYSHSDVDAGTAPEPAVIVIPAVVSPASRKEQPLREWLARWAGRGARLLGVCAGARLLAAAGLLDGHRATTHWSRISALQRTRPQVDWVRGQRYIQDELTTINPDRAVTGGQCWSAGASLRLREIADSARLAGRSIGQRRTAIYANSGVGDVGGARVAGEHRAARRLAPGAGVSWCSALCCWAAMWAAGAPCRWVRSSSCTVSPAFPVADSSQSVPMATSVSAAILRRKPAGGLALAGQPRPAMEFTLRGPRRMAFGRITSSNGKESFSSR